MTPQEFFNKNNYKPINWDNALGFQCMDLYHQYVNDVLAGYPHPPAKGAAWLIGLLPSSHYTWINNGLLDVPQLGDILLWGTKAGGGYGHVAIYSSGNVLNFTSFDQNYPLGSYAHYQGHNYFGDLKGWYRPKPITNWDDKRNKMLNALNAGGTSENRTKEADKIFHS